MVFFKQEKGTMQKLRKETDKAVRQKNNNVPTPAEQLQDRHRNKNGGGYQT